MKFTNDPDTSSLLVVPSDTIIHHLGPFLDAPSLLALSSTAKYYHGIFRKKYEHSLTRALWRNLCVDRWRCIDFSRAQLADISQDEGYGDDDGAPQISDELVHVPENPWMKEYQRRHVIDKEASNKLRQILLLSNLNSKSTNKTPLPFTSTSVMALQQRIVDVVSQGRNVMDIVLRQYQSNRYCEEDKHKLKIVQRSIVRYDVCERFKALRENQYDEHALVDENEWNRENGKDRNDGSCDVNINSAEPPLEYGALLFARFYCTTRTTTSEYPFQKEGCTCSNMETYVENELNVLAQTLLDRLEQRYCLKYPQHSTSSDDQNQDHNGRHGRTGRKYPMLMVLEEMQHFFISQADAEDMDEDEINEMSPRPFRGNSASYYSSSNSMIHEILKSRKGIPITLAIVYIAIVRRAIGVEMSAMGLPGHFMLSTTIVRPNNVNVDADQEEMIFIDVFDGGRMVTLPEVQNMIASNYFIPWDDRFLIPVPKMEVWNRMLRNLLNCGDIPDNQKLILKILGILGFDDGRLNFDENPELKKDLIAKL